MEHITRKIRALIATANDDGASENERETALRMVQGMLVKHNLEMADVFEVKEGREDLENIQFGTPWACSIAHNIRNSTCAATTLAGKSHPARQRITLSASQLIQLQRR